MGYFISKAIQDVYIRKPPQHILMVWSRSREDLMVTGTTSTTTATTTAAAVVGLTSLGQVKHLVVGAGVVGLAVAAALAKRAAGGSTLIIDKNPRVGEETSSRNSEVIHAGLYYPPQSLKTKLCIRGKNLLYERCERVGSGVVNFKKVGRRLPSISFDASIRH